MTTETIVALSNTDEVVVGLLNKYRHVQDRFFYEDISLEDEIKEETSQGEFCQELKDNNIEFECVDQHGGEGQGEEFWLVYEFKNTVAKESCYIQFEGWYASYNGAEYVRFYNVKPVQVVVRQWHYK